ncbi:hypothetical protein [Aurantimonas coralicida]|uniref:hypothetical protein n=1 Tax=Aurantimonas coralicida TaxID=182270 RepID=UPI0023978849|nr:hypothetical protein [Aurantimonas coralicida]MDE0921357.1 hypothetical protein [Aurantimonas coralicida]
MTDAIRLSRTDTYQNTIAGLLTKRADLFNEAERIRDRLAEIKNDIDALDRVLGTLGYTGNLDTEMPRQKRHVVFGKGELATSILRELRMAEGPLTAREIATSIVAVSGDQRDRKHVVGVTGRVGKALRQQIEKGVVRSSRDERGNVFYALRDRRV